MNSKEISKLKSIPRTLDLCGMYIDDETFVSTYRGVSYHHDSPYVSVTLNFDFEIDVPGNILSSGNIGYLRLPSGGTPITPLQTLTATPNIQLLYTYYDSGLMTDFNKYKVTYSIAIPYNSFCAYFVYEVRLRINTDCDIIESFSTSWSRNPLTPTTTYQPHSVWAYCSAPNTIHFEQVDVLSGLDCHYPTLGSSPKYIVEYKHESSSTWIPLPGGVLYWSGVRLVTVTPGTYDYRYRGLVSDTPTDSYSPFSPWYSVTVY